MKRLLSVMALAGIFLSSVGAQFGGYVKNPWEIIDYGDADLNAVLDGAPPYAVYGGARDADGMPRVIRIDFNALTVAFDSTVVRDTIVTWTTGASARDTLLSVSGDSLFSSWQYKLTSDNPVSKWTSGQFIYTFGGGVPESCSMKIAPTSGTSTVIGLTPSSKDSAESVILSKPALSALTDSTEAFFYAKFAKTFAGGGSQVFGFGDGFNAYGGAVNESPWKPDQWDGTLNNSHENSVYFKLDPVTTPLSDSLKVCKLIVNPSGSPPDTVSITFNTPLAPLAATQMEFAFHVFGFDSLQWFAEDTSGSVADLSGSLTAEADSPAQIVFGDLATIGGGAVGNATGITFTEMWAAVTPRR